MFDSQVVEFKKHNPEIEFDLYIKNRESLVRHLKEGTVDIALMEEYFIEEETANVINDTILSGGRIVSVGTTSTRTLESAAYFDENKGKFLVKTGRDNTGIFIYPGYEYRIVKALITNFHLPKSTLIMLISALYDRKEILRAYDEAVREKYRFFSYGDAMMIE